MSSLRNAVQRREHRERAQPLERRRLGLLEKHKDYSLRAKDYNKKKEHLKKLRQRAADRNDDEFYFGMMSRKGPGSAVTQGKNWKGTVAGDRGNKPLSVEAVRLLKTQDIGYVRTMKQVVAKEVARLQEQVVLTRGLDRLHEDGGPSKIVFLDDEEERREVMKGQKTEVKDGEVGEDDEGREKAVRQLQRQLDTAREKLKALSDAELELEVQQAKMAKTATSGGYTKSGKKIMVRTRKR